MFENLVTSRWRCFERAWNLTGGSRLLGVGLEAHSLALLFHNSGSLKSEASHTFLLLPAPTHFLTMLCCCPISSCELRERITTLTSLVRDLVILMKAGAGHHQDVPTSAPLFTAPLATVSASGLTTTVLTVPINTSVICRSRESIR